MMTGQMGELIKNSKGKINILEMVNDLRSSHFPMGYENV
jgi:hypothetical protein